MKRKKKLSSAKKDAKKGAVKNPSRKSVVVKRKKIIRDSRAKKSSAPAIKFPIVGIGASAGGLDALTRFLKPLPADFGMALIIIQHLDPNHENRTSEILSNCTPMPVSEAKNNERVEPGHVYVIPAHYDLQIHEGCLKLSPRTASAGLHFPIDLFFRSLAQERGNQAIGIILSGVASDGTQGLRSLKAAGGMTFAQDPVTAKFAGMPENAIASGAVDFIQTPEMIASELINISHRSSLAGEPNDHVSKSESLNKIFVLLQNGTQTDFSQYKLSTIQRRIQRRLGILKLKDYESYAQYLEIHPEEVQILFAETLIHVTRFFRDPKAFETLKTKTFPKYMKDLDPSLAFRIWVPGCATGEEAYSIAITFFEKMDGQAIRSPLQIFATDISEEAIRKARIGVYPETISKDVSKVRLLRFFEKVPGGYKISKQLRDVCVFSKHDCTSNPPFAKVDMVSCRNLLIYFGSELQKRVLPIFHYALKPNGILWLGSSETIGELSNLFSFADKNAKIYLKKSNSMSPNFHFPLNRFVPEKVNLNPKESSLAVSMQDLQRETDRVTISEYGPPCVVINDSMEILQARGHTAPFLELPSGRVSLNLLKMVRREIVTDLRSIIILVGKNGGTVKREGLTLQENNRVRTFSIKVVPIRIGQPKEQFFSIYFEESKASPKQKDLTAFKIKKNQKKSGKEKSLFELQQRLSELQDYKQSISEEFETTQESLSASNEELQSSNEELQSTNEELDTAKEELQSSNEELTTVNDELQTRNSELLQSTNDLGNLINSVDIPMVIVGPDTRVRHFTPNAGKILKLIPADEGRAIGDIKTEIQVQDLDKIVLEVMKTMTVKEFDTKDSQGKWHRLQIKPYRTSEKNVDGAVIALIEIDSLKRNVDELKKARDDAKAIVEGLPIPLLVIGSDLRIRLANQPFCDNFKINRQAIEGKFIFEIESGQWNIPKLMEMLNKTLTEDVQYRGFELDHNFQRIGKRTIALSSRRTYLSGTGEAAVLLDIEDFTQRKQNETKLKESEEKYRSLLASTYDGIMVIDKAGVIEFANQQLELMFGYHPGELLGQPCEILIPDEYKENHLGYLRQFFSNPDQRETSRGIDIAGRRKDGAEFPVAVSLSAVKLSTGTFATCTIHDTSELKKIEVERKRILVREKELRGEAEKANRIKDEFLATLSHELRTPLTTVLTWAQILRLGIADTEKTKRGIEVIERSAKAQSQLIDDLLDVSRINSGKLILNIEEVDPAEPIHAVLDMISPLASKKSIQIDTIINPVEGKILADPAKLHQVFWNLLTNAIKFSAEGSKIKVSLDQIKTKRGKCARIQVIDHGRGIRSDFLPEIFKRFTQADSSTTRVFGGLGLGMSIVHSLVEMQNGEVTAESSGEGLGATFTVTFPLAAKALVVQESGQSTLSLPAPKSKYEIPASLSGIHILLVDDEVDARGALATLLESFGAEMKVAGSASEGLQLFLASKPDVLISDIGMPDQDGYSFIKKIRALKPEQGKKTPSLALSAYAGAEDIRHAMEAGFSEHVAKPVDAIRLSHVIEALARKGKKNK